MQDKDLELFSENIEKCTEVMETCEQQIKANNEKRRKAEQKRNIAMGKHYFMLFSISGKKELNKRLIDFVLTIRKDIDSGLITEDEIYALQEEIRREKLSNTNISVSDDTDDEEDNNEKKIF